MSKNKLYFLFTEGSVNQTYLKKNCLLKYSDTRFLSKYLG